MEGKRKYTNFASLQQKTLIMETQKMKMSQDALYKYLNDHDVKMTPIAKLMGVVPEVVMSCFKHHMNHNGNRRSFSVENIAKLNDALPQLAKDLRSCVMTFGTDKVVTNRRGVTYDPGMLEPMKELGKVMNVMALIERLLGWSKPKKRSVFNSPTNRAYGNITEQDVAIINKEILEVAGVLGNIEVVPDVNAFEGYGSSSSSDDGSNI